MKSPGTGIFRKIIIFGVAPLAAVVGIGMLIISHPAGADPQDSALIGFGQPARWADALCAGEQTCAAGDVNGDGKADAVAFTHAGQGEVSTALSTGRNFGKPARWASAFCAHKAETCRLADVTGDGKADAVAYLGNAGEEHDRGAVVVAVSNGKSFGRPATWAGLASGQLCISDDDTCMLADVNGDKKADAVVISKGGRVTVALSNGKRFGSPARWADGLCGNGAVCAVADVTGDKKADVVVFTRSQRADVLVAASTGKGFAKAARWLDSFCPAPATCRAADITGDGRADVLAFGRNDDDTGELDVSVSTGEAFVKPNRSTDTLCAAATTCALADVDGDHQADAVGFKQGGKGEVDVALATAPSKAKTNTDPSANPSGAAPSVKASPNAVAGSPSAAGPALPKVTKGAVFHPSTEAAACNCTTPTSGMTAIANAIKVRSASVSAVAAVPAGLAVTNATEISMLFDTNHRITQPYNAQNGNRITYDFPVKDGKARKEKVDVNLLEKAPGGAVTYHFVVEVAIEPLYYVEVSPFTFTLEVDCDFAGKSEVEILWYDDRGKHKSNFDLGFNESGTENAFARTQIDARVAYDMQQPVFEFDELDPSIGGFTAEPAPPYPALLPGTTYNFSKRLVADHDKDCKGTMKYTARIELQTFSML